MDPTNSRVAISTLSVQYLCELSNACLPSVITLTDLEIKEGVNLPDSVSEAEFLNHVFVERQRTGFYAGIVLDNRFVEELKVLRVELADGGSIRTVHSAQTLGINEEIIGIHQDKWVTLTRVRAINNPLVDCSDFNDQVRSYNWDFSTVVSSFDKTNITSTDLDTSGAIESFNTVILGASLDERGQLLLVSVNREGCYVPEDQAFVTDPASYDFIVGMNMINFVEVAQLKLTSQLISELHSPSVIYENSDDTLQPLFVFDNDRDATVNYPMSHGIGFLNGSGHLDSNVIRPIIREDSIVIMLSPAIIVVK